MARKGESHAEGRGAARRASRTGRPRWLHPGTRETSQAGSRGRSVHLRHDESTTTPITTQMDHVAPDVVYRYSTGMTTATATRGGTRRSRRALEDLSDVLSNVAIGVGLLFIIAIGLDLRLGTPSGLAGFVSGLALIGAGLAQIALPAKLRRLRRAQVARAEARGLALGRFVA